MNNCRFGNVHCIFFAVHTEFSLISLLCRRKNLLRSCSFVKFFFGRLVVLVFFLSLSIARKYSVLQQTGGDTQFFATVYLIGFVFRRTLHSVFYQFFNCFLTGIASLNITAQCRPQTRDPNMISPTFPKLILRNGNYSQRICRIML